MAIKQFRLPDVGEGLTEAEILGWSVAVGDEVKVNQVLVEIETAKAAVELPSPFAGKVSALLVEAGQTVDVGAPDHRDRGRRRRAADAVRARGVDAGSASGPGRPRRRPRLRSASPSWSATASPSRPPPAGPGRTRRASVRTDDHGLRSRHPGRSARTRRLRSRRPPAPSRRPDPRPGQAPGAQARQGPRRGPRRRSCRPARTA